jgi:hypothetical protein
MKRYIMFSGECCYPKGGWDDLTQDFDTLDEAAEKTDEINKSEWSWAHVVDTETMTKVRGI